MIRKAPYISRLFGFATLEVSIGIKVMFVVLNNLLSDKNRKDYK